MSQNNEKYENTPGGQAMAVMKDINKEIIFKKPIGAPRKRHKEKVLDEDTYVEVSGVLRRSPQAVFICVLGDW